MFTCSPGWVFTKTLCLITIVKKVHRRFRFFEGPVEFRSRKATQPRELCLPSKNWRQRARVGSGVGTSANRPPNRPPSCWFGIRSCFCLTSLIVACSLHCIVMYNHRKLKKSASPLAVVYSVCPPPLAAAPATGLNPCPRNVE